MRQNFRQRFNFSSLNSRSACPLAFILFSQLLPVAPEALGADSSGWEKIQLAGDTMCSDGSPYSIFVHRGTSGKLVLDFMGGGACWNAATCDAPRPTYTRKVPDVIGQWLPDADGIYNRNRSENPFRNDTHVMLPYCTGDIHWGTADRAYSQGHSPKSMIHHRGAINAKAAIDQTFAQIVTDPSQIFVTGCSAGAYGAIWWTPYIRQQAPRSKIIQFADSGAGILTETFRQDGFKNWNIERSLPRWIPGLDLDATEVLKISMPQLYGAISKELSNVRFSQFNSLNDIIQKYFFKTMGGDQHAWSGKLRQAMNETVTNAQDFTYYISPWDAHCILPYQDFYGETRNALQSQTFPSWFDSVLNSEAPINEPCAGCTEELGRGT
jgi:Pectinacetylesterase